VVHSEKVGPSIVEQIELATDIGYSEREPVYAVISCVGASLLSSGKLCEQPLSFEQQSLRASRIRDVLPSHLLKRRITGREIHDGARLLPWNWAAAREVATMNVMRVVDRIARIRIVLNGIDPTIWRRVQVPLTTSLKGLHDVIQAVMPFENYMLMGEHEIALIFADVRLSGAMDGVALAWEVKLRWPGLPVILTSGLPRELVGDLPLGVDYMLKPWQPLNLLVAAKQALAARHG
jgi:CheY-like chemotaxis protein